jgi:hypothetical protein
MAVVIEKYFPKDYGDSRAIAGVVIESMLEQGLDVVQRQHSIDLLRSEGYQMGQIDARKHFATLAADGLDAHQFRTWDGESLLVPTTCSCGWEALTGNNKKGKSFGEPWDQWIAGIARR